MGLKYSLEYRLATAGLQNVEVLVRDSFEKIPGTGHDIVYYVQNERLRRNKLLEEDFKIVKKEDKELFLHPYIEYGLVRSIPSLVLGTGFSCVFVYPLFQDEYGEGVRTFVPFILGAFTGSFFVTLGGVPSHANEAWKKYQDYLQKKKHS